MLNMNRLGKPAGPVTITDSWPFLSSGSGSVPGGGTVGGVSVSEGGAMGGVSVSEGGRDGECSFKLQLISSSAL